MDKRQRRAKINAASTLLNQLVATLCGVLIPWLMIDAFGSEAYGATTSIAQFLSYISLLEGGIGRAARGEMYKPLADGDTENISRVYMAVKRFFNTIGMAFLVYAFILAFCYYDIADVAIFSRDYIFWLVLAITVGKFAEFMGGYSNITLFNADQRQYVSNVTVIATALLNVLLVALLCRAGCDLLWVKIGSSLVFVIKPVVYSLYRKKHYTILPTKQRAKLKNQWTAIGQHIAYFVQTNVAIFVLTVFADLKLVAVYSVYHMISFSLRNIVTSFGGGMEAMFGDMIARNEMDALEKAYKRYKMILTMLTVTLFGTAMVLILPFVRLYTAGVTDTNYIHPLFAGILLLGDALYCLTLPCYNLPIAAGKLKESRSGAYAEALIGVVVSVVLVFWNPLLGVAIGAFASMLFKSVYLIFFAGRQVLYVRPWKMLWDFVFTTAVLALIAWGGNYLVSYFAIYNYVTWILYGFATVAVMGLLAIVLGFLLYPGAMKRLLKGRRSRSAVFTEQNTEATSVKEDLLSHDIAAYAGYLVDHQELLQCTSGGIATALARQMIKEGGFVAGVSYSEDFSEARYGVIHQTDQLDSLKGSKYTEVKKGTIYADVKALLDRGEAVLFFGLPCVVAALRHYLGKEYEKLIAVELICHGPTSAEVHRQYVNHLEKKFKSKIVEFSVRRKDGAWLPGYLYAKFENGQVFQKSFYHTEYGYAFSVMAKKSCYTCKFRGNNRTGDIMIGDFRGAKEEDLFWNKNGVSAILVHTQKGDAFLHRTEGIQLFSTTVEHVMRNNPNIIKPRQIRKETEKFEKLFAQHGLFYAVQHSKSFTGRAKAIIKKTLLR